MEVGVIAPDDVEFCQPRLRCRAPRCLTLWEPSDCSMTPWWSARTSAPREVAHLHQAPLELPVLLQDAGRRRLEVC
jgi:hypothetical protein